MHAKYLLRKERRESKFRQDKGKTQNKQANKENIYK